MRIPYVLTACMSIACAVFSAALAPSVAAAGDPVVDRWTQDLAGIRPRRDTQPLSSFAGTVRLPRRDLALFDGPALSHAEVARDGLTQRVTYTVELGSPAASGSITMSGMVGRRPEIDAAPPSDCLQPGPNYCADTGYIEGPPTGETFFQLRSRAGHPGRVEHGVCCNGQNWAVKWYVPEDDTTHSLWLYLEAADRVGDFDLVPLSEDNTRRLGPGNVSAAQWLLDLTDSFIGFRKGSAVDVPPAPAADPTLARVARARIHAANEAWATLVGRDAEDYNLDAWAGRSYGGVANVQLGLTLPAMRREGRYHEARQVAAELTGARRLADGTVEASTHEVWEDRILSVHTGAVIADLSGQIDQTYTLGLVDGAWKVLEIKAPRSSLN